jgi:hypothetical protein
MQSRSAMRPWTLSDSHSFRAPNRRVSAIPRSAKLTSSSPGAASRT